VNKFSVKTKQSGDSATLRPIEREGMLNLQIFFASWPISANGRTKSSIKIWFFNT